MSARYRRPPILDRISPERHARVEASAGTGKTFTHERLILDRILGGTEIGDILVLTFTDQAATEMRERIRKLLREIDSLPEDANGDVPLDEAWTIDETARLRVREALRSFDSATISTIHAFCNRILGEQAFANRRLFEEETVDSRSLFSRAFADVLRTFVVDEEWGWLVEAWLVESSAEELEKFLFECLRSPGSIVPTLDYVKVEAVLDLFPLGEETGARIQEAWKEVKERTGSRKRIGTAIDRWQEIRDILGPASTGADVCERLRAGWKVLALKGSKETHLRTILGYLDEMIDPPPEVERLRRFCRVLPESLPSREAAIASVLLPRIEAELGRRKRAEGLLDFDDMLRALHRTLESPEGESLAEALRARYRYAILDEFQDTDEVQWAIFRKLFLEGGGKNVLYAIGDPKQAIYGFRGADVGTYLQAREEIVERGGDRVVLEDCFRATGELIGAYNRIFEQEAERPFFSGAIRYDHPVGCGRPELRLTGPGGDPAPAIHVFELEEGLLSAEVGKLLAKRAAEEIRRLVRPEDPVVLWDEGKGPRPISYGDVYVLYRKAFEGKEIAEVFRECGIPFAFYKEEGLFQRPEAWAFLDLLRALDAPDDPAARLRAWLSPFFGIRLRDLPRTRDLPPDHPLVERLLSWAEDARERRWERLFSRVLDESGILRRAIATGDERALTNYLHVAESLQERVHRQAPSCGELADWLLSLIEERARPDREDGNQQRLETDRDAVKLMTLHASKGLEAPIVFVLGRLSSKKPPSKTVRFRDESGERRLWAGKPPPSVAERAEREEREEAERLLYVGLTRARARLYLPLRPGGGGDFAPLFERLVDLRSQEPRGFEWERLSTVGPARASAKTAKGNAIEFEAEEVRDEAFPALREAHLGFVVTSYSRMRGFRGVEGEEERIEGERMVVEPGPDELPGGAATGIFLHDVLARIPFEEVPENFDAFRASPKMQRIFQEAARVHGISAEHLPHAWRLVWAGLSTPLARGALRLDGGVARADRWRTEMEFLYPLPARERERGFVKGFVDLVFESEGRVYFADWKSDCLPSFDAAYVRRYVQSSYELQIRLYAIAIRKLYGLETESEFEERFGGAFYFFLRGMEREGEAGVYFERPSWEALTRWELELEKAG